MISSIERDSRVSSSVANASPPPLAGTLRSSCASRRFAACGLRPDSWPSDGVGELLPRGTRLHALADLSLPLRAPGWWLVPRLAVNAASYQVDPATQSGYRVSRTIPTASLDAGLLFERSTRIAGRDLRQTLEPRLLYVSTPYRDQRLVPNFDAAAKDFNEVSVYSANAFSGVDRVSDAHQATFGVTTRFFEDRSGAELLRLGIAQRLLLRDQRITPNADGSANIDVIPEGPAATRRLSDLLLFGGATIAPRWKLDAAIQYNGDIDRPVRSRLAAVWSPGPFRTISAGYRYARGSSEQVEVAWQWPLYRRDVDASIVQLPPRPGTLRSAARDELCAGTVYGVGRINYSMRESRLTDSILGLEYDAGCWIGRVVLERQSTGRREAATRLLLQLELVGLSKLGSNPLQTLRDNVPGYRLLRDNRDDEPTIPVYK